MAFSVADVKAEVRVTHNHEDTLIARKLAAAQDYAEEAIGRKLVDIPGGVPVALEEAIIGLAAHLYEWRGVATEAAMSDIPHSFTSLLRTYRYNRWPDAE